MRNRHFIFNVIIFMLILTIGISISYAFFSNSLNIKGNLHTNQYIGGNKLLIDTILLNAGSNKYTVEVIPKNVQYVSESLNNNILNLNYKISNTGRDKGSGSVKFELRNTYPIAITDGKVSLSVQGSSVNIYNVQASIDNAILNSNDIVTCTITYDHDTFKMTQNNVINATISYMVNSNLQYYYFTLTITV